MKCPVCSAFINPAWERCHACGGALKGAAFIEAVRPDSPGPAGEADFERIASRHWNRAARFTPDGTGELIAERWPGLNQRIKEGEAELNTVWLSCKLGERTFPDTLPAFKTAVKKWGRLNIEAARYVRYLDRGIRRVYSRKLGEWVYIVKDKATVRGVRLKPRGAVYTVEEAKSLLEANPGPEELRALHRAKTVFQGELSAGS